MDPTIARKGIEETEKVHQLFQQLLQAIGHGNLMFDKSKNPDPASVPEKCEKNNVLVAEILENIKKSLAEAKQCYQHCHSEMTANSLNVPTLEEISKQGKVKMEIAPSEEYNILRKQLQEKNEDLKFIIDEVRHIFSDINQLSTSVPY